MNFKICYLNKENGRIKNTIFIFFSWFGWWKISFYWFSGKSDSIDRLRLFSFVFSHIKCLCVGNGDLNLYTRFDVDRCDLLDDFTWRMQIDDAFVYTHLETIPGLTTFTARCFTGGDAKHLRWPSDWTFDAELLFLGTRNQIGAHFFQRTNIGRGQDDTDAVHGGYIGFRFFQIFALSCLSNAERKNRTTLS